MTASPSPNERVRGRTHVPRRMGQPAARLRWRLRPHPNRGEIGRHMWGWLVQDGTASGPRTPDLVRPVPEDRLEAHDARLAWDENSVRGEGVDGRGAIVVHADLVGELGRICSGLRPVRPAMAHSRRLTSAFSHTCVIAWTTTCDRRRGERGRTPRTLSACWPATTGAAARRLRRVPGSCWVRAWTTTHLGATPLVGGSRWRAGGSPRRGPALVAVGEPRASRRGAGSGFWQTLGE